MYKSFLLATALTTTVTALVIMAPSSARKAFAAAPVDDPFSVAEDNVFMDDSSGDLGAGSGDAPVDEKPAKKDSFPAKKASGKSGHGPASSDDPMSDSADTSLSDLDAPAAGASPEMKEEATQNLPTSEPGADFTGDSTPPPPASASMDSGDDGGSAAEAPSKKKKKHTKKPKVAKASSGGAKGKGKFVQTKETCPMLREPASDGEKMITVKADRKIWVEEVDETWVRAFNKAGEPGYVSRDCVE